LPRPTLVTARVVVDRNCMQVRTALGLNQALRD
jgi:hypothetical protein